MSLLLISWLLVFHLIWKHYILTLDFDMKSWIFDFSTHFTKKTTTKQIFLSKYLCKSKLFPNPKILGFFLAFFFNNWTFLHIFAHCYEFSEILGRFFNFQTWVMVRTFPFGVELYTWLGKIFCGLCCCCCFFGCAWFWFSKLISK